MSKIYLGTIEDERIYLVKHSFDCNWYWGFGYLSGYRKGEREQSSHFHIDSLIQGSTEEVTNVNKIFNTTWISQDLWWILRELFNQAYALKKAAQVYKYGANQTSEGGYNKLLYSEEKNKSINEDLKKVLDTIWNILETKSLGRKSERKVD